MVEKVNYSQIENYYKFKVSLFAFNKKALKEEYTEWIQASKNIKEQPHVLYSNQINIEQL
jgi:hypothetical protein